LWLVDAPCHYGFVEESSLIGSLLSQDGFMPHGHCYLWRPELVGLHVVTDSIIGLAYVSISLTLYSLVRKIKLPFTGMFLAFGLFIFACGATHFMEVWTTWTPDYWTSALVKFVTAGASIATAIYLVPIAPQVVRVAEEAKLAEQHRLKLASYSEELEKRVQERTAELEAALRLRDEFISVAAHELRTPLTSVQMRLDGLRRQFSKDKLQADQQIVRSIDVASNQTRRISALTDQLLDIARLTSGRLEIVREEYNLTDLLENIRQQFEAAASRAGSPLEMRIETTPLPVLIDQLRMEQVAANLVSNAIRYGGGGPIEIFARRENERVLFGVRDQGVGIPQENLVRIFERFERGTTDQSTGGLGLGLYIAKEIVELHDGTLAVESEPGKGSTFTVDLPAAGA
jgi:signal transduction histidine kinase